MGVAGQCSTAKADTIEVYACGTGRFFALDDELPGNLTVQLADLLYRGVFPAALKDTSESGARAIVVAQLQRTPKRRYTDAESRPTRMREAPASAGRTAWRGTKTAWRAAVRGVLLRSRARNTAKHVPPCRRRELGASCREPGTVRAWVFAN
jgi:hypothetical protein